MFGFCFGLAMMVKQSILFFLFLPLLWLSITLLWQRSWRRIAQLIGGFVLSVFIFGPWYRTNWLFLFSATQNAAVIPALEEGDPPINTLAAWTYYWNDLPRAVSWPLLLVPLVGLLLYWIGLFPAFRNRGNAESTNDTSEEYRTQKSEYSREVNPKSKIQNPKPFGRANIARPIASTVLWLALFFIGSYLISLGEPNKDLRYFMPCLPILSVFWLMV
jgi:4-amino-4-deoxy-L-arabinose transferase-like glycosyltransferase